MSESVNTSDRLSELMRDTSFKIEAVLRILFLLVLSAVYSTAQDAPLKLELNDPRESEIKGGETQVFGLSLETGRTARVEIVQYGVDVSLAAVDPAGEKFIKAESPSGFYGDDLILVTAKVAGEYRIEVTPADPRAGKGKYTITLREIRPTAADDFAVNEAAGRLTGLAEAATVAKYKGTLEGRRDALAKWDEVIELSKIKRDRVWEGVALVAKGLIYEQLGELQNALDVYLKSLAIWKDLGNLQYEGSCVNNIGSVYTGLGEYEKSIAYYGEAIEIQREIGDRKSVGIYLNNLAHSYMNLGDYYRAEKFFRQSLQIKGEDESLRGQRSLANTLNNLGTTFYLRGDTAAGLDYLQQALRLRQKIEHRWGIANSLLNVGKALRRAGEKREGFEKLSEANRRAREVGDRQLEAQTLYHLAAAERESGDLDKAVEQIARGLELIERIRGELIGSEVRYAYFSTVQDYYELYIDLLVARFEKTKNEADLILALETSERSRSRSLVELLQEAKVRFREGVDPALLEDLRNSQKLINEKYVRRQDILSGTPKPEDLMRINDEINELDTRIRNLNIKIRREHPKFAELTEGRTVSVKEIQNLLDDESVLVEYKLGAARSFVWLVTGDSLEIHELPPRSEIEKKAGEFYAAVVAGQNEEIPKLSDDLSRILLAPFAGKLGRRRLVIVAEGILQYAPFSALNSPSGGFLADQNEIVVLPSASVLARLRENPARTNEKTVAVFADPVFDKNDPRIRRKSVAATDDSGFANVLRDFGSGENLPRLLASRREAREISAFVGKERALVRTDFEANLENVRNADLTRYKILHFATHGLLNTSRPELSGLVFSLYDRNGRPQEGFLSLDEIYNLRLASDLVVLSACQTALGRDVRGEGLIGISRGFLYAGSKRIVASLWKVDDAATAEFMKLFYRSHLEKEMPASAALRQAKLDMKKIPRYRSPFYWSAFTLLGDWR
jgi:CHAT domain-containing protein/Tfp pilus assembly protein PilF